MWWAKVVDDFDRNNFNTALAAIMELTNAASDYLRKCSPEERAGCEGSRAVDAEVAEVLVKLLGSFRRIGAEELVGMRCGKTVRAHAAVA